MDDNIKLLEERAIKVVDRLRDLSAERKKLEQELRVLRDRLKGFERSGTTDQDENEEAWRSHRAEAIEVIRRTLAELRGA